MLHFYGHQTGYGRAGHMGGKTAPKEGRRCVFAVLPLTVALALALAGCAGSQPAVPPPPTLGLRCVDDSAHCISQREKVFDSYMADKSRAWIKQPAAPEAYASGVRLFALSKRRKDLSCDELAMGKRETDGAPSALRGSGGSRLTPAQVSRSVMLAGDVGRELAKEISKRCGKT